MIKEAFETIKTRVVNPDIKWENEYIEPKHGVTYGDRKSFFTSYNKELLDRISQHRKLNS